MTTISMEQIKELRAKSNAGISDCKKALQESNGDMDAAVDWLRKKGLSTAAKKSGNVAAEGVVGVKVKGDKSKGVIVEINTQTDFVAKNEQFQQLSHQILELALDNGSSIDALKEATFTGKSHSVQDEVVNNIAVIGENISLRRVQEISCDNGIVVSYLHNAETAELGKIAVLVALESTGDKNALEALGKRVAMHIAATKPEALTIEEVPEESVSRERAVVEEQSRASGKPENVIEKMVEGRIRKFYEEVVLLKQAFVMDGKTKIEDVLKEAEKEVGAPVSISSYAFFVLGEGIEKQESDFAAEVAAAVKQ